MCVVCIMVLFVLGSAQCVDDRLLLVVEKLSPDPRPPPVIDGVVFRILYMESASIVRFLSRKS